MIFTNIETGSMDEVRRDVMRMIKAGGTIFFTKDGENVREMSEKADVIETIEKIIQNLWPPTSTSGSRSSSSTACSTPSRSRLPTTRP